MDNVIKIRTSLTDEWVEAILKRHKNVHVAIYEHYKGYSTYIVTTNDVQEVFELGREFGAAVANNGKYVPPQPQGRRKATRGKGNE